MAVLCGLSGGSAQDVIIAVLSAGLEKETNVPLAAIEKFGNTDAFWSLVQKYTGFANDDDRPLSDLAAHILVTALSQTMPNSALKGLERFVCDPCKAYCYQLVHEWQRDSFKFPVPSFKISNSQLATLNYSLFAAMSSASYAFPTVLIRPK